MAFSFGSSNTPAPATAFGSKAAPAPAPAFGATPASAPAFGVTPAPAPAFGATPAPAPAFGATPGPAPAFGATSAPAPAFGAATGGGLFGSTTPAPAPAGGLFGSTPAAAASTGGLFGSSTATPAPAGGFFGSTTTSTTSATAPTNAPMVINGQTPYASLPPNIKQAIDKIHDQIWNHKRAMAQVSSMYPVLLRPPQKEADAAAGDTSSLSYQLEMMEQQASQLEMNIKTLSEDAFILKDKYEKSTTQSTLYGIWPIEAVAARKGVKLTSATSQQKQQQSQQQQSEQQKQQNRNESQNPTVEEQIRKSLELQMAHVDRLEKIPSPYMWSTLEDMEARLLALKDTMQAIQYDLEQRGKIQSLGFSCVVQSQNDFLFRISNSIQRLQREMEQLRNKYSYWETGTNVFVQQQIKDLEFQHRQAEKVQIAYLKAAEKAQPALQPPNAAITNTGIGAPAASSGLFGSKPAGGSLFGSAPAPSGGGLFGSNPTPAPTGGLFGSNPAPAPSGGLFGSTPAPGAPAPAGGLFGSTPAPGAPAPAVGLFGSTPAPAPGAPAPAGGLFGSTPAPGAPAKAGGLFGSTPSAAPTPAGGLFGASAPAAPAFGAAPSPFGSSTTTTKPKNKSRGSRRR